MTQNLSPMQEAFEAWVVTQNVVKKYNANLTKSWNNQFYRDYRVNDRWMAWQAAHKRPITLPTLNSSLPTLNSSVDALRKLGFENVTVGGCK